MSTYDPATEKVVPKDAVVIRDWLPGPNHREHLLDLLREHHWSHLADEIERETKPPRIPEPDWGAIVEAGVDAHDERLLWTPNDQGLWSCKNPDEYARHWLQLVDPVLIRDGIEGAS